MKRPGQGAHRRSHEAGGHNSAVEGAAVRTYERAEKRRPGLYRGYAAGIPDEPADTGRRWTAGKTLVAAAAAYFAFLNGHGTMVMAPTEVLAQQHYKTFTEMLSGLGVRVELLSGSLTVKEKNDVRRRAESGEIDVLIGTQALIQKTSAMSSAGPCYRR